MGNQSTKYHSHIRRYGTRVVHLFEDLGLIIILIATFIAGSIEVQHMWIERRVQLDDLLLMFIYVETLTMVKVYWESGKLPVRMPLYIAIVAIARYLIIDIKEMDNIRALAVASSILMVAIAVLVVRWGHVKLPYPTTTNKEEDIEG